MAKTNNYRGITPIGELFFPHLITPEVVKGKNTNKFTTGVKFSEKDTQAFLKLIDTEWQKFAESEEGMKHKYKYDIVNGFKNYKGTEYFKFSMAHKIDTKKGLWERTVPVFDAKKHEVTDISHMGSGSKARIAFELVPFYMSDKNYGISLRLEAVQVLEMKEYNGATADSFGFGEEDGFDSTEEATIDNPFEDVPAPDDEDF